MSVQLKLRVIATIKPLNKSREVNIERIDNNNIKLNIVIDDNKSYNFIAPWKELWKTIFLKTVQKIDFPLFYISKVIYISYSLLPGHTVTGSRESKPLRSWLVICSKTNVEYTHISTKDLKEALLLIK